MRHHLHLAYASTVHGVQGETADHADLMLSDDHTDAAAAVRRAHPRPATPTPCTSSPRTSTTPRSSGSQAAGRNRADLGLDQARAAATAEAHNYAPTTQPGRPASGHAAGRDRRASFADRMRRLSARVDDGVPGAVVVDEPAVRANGTSTRMRSRSSGSPVHVSVAEFGSDRHQCQSTSWTQLIQSEKACSRA